MSEASQESLSPNWHIRLTRDVSDKIPLRYGLYSPKGDAFDRCIIFLNGRTEWIEKYAELPVDLRLPDSCAFLTLDHRGQGGSGGKRSYVDSFDDFARDVQKVVREVVGGRPTALIAHSMGGLIGMYATLKGYIDPRAVVLSGPLFELPDHPIPRVLQRPIAMAIAMAGGGPISSGAGRFERDRFEDNKLTHSFEMFRRIHANPYPVPGATFGWVNAAYSALNVVFDPEHLKKLAAPVLVMAGGEECVVGPGGFAKWVDAATRFAGAPVKFEIIPEALHELYTEIPKYRDVVIRNTRKWLEEFLGRASAQ